MTERNYVTIYKSFRGSQFDIEFSAPAERDAFLRQIDDMARSNEDGVAVSRTGDDWVIVNEEADKRLMEILKKS